MAINLTINNISGSADRSNFGAGDTYNAQNLNQHTAPRFDPDWRDIFFWLIEERKDLNFIPLQQELASKCQPDSGSWFIGSAQFERWRDEFCEILFCHGGRGIGKTMLVSLAVNHLEELRRPEETKLLVLFCYFSRDYTHDCDAYLAALLGQILQKRRTASARVKDLFTYHKPLNSRPKANQLTDAVLAELSDHDEIFILLDALDEATRQARSDFVRKLVELRARREKVRLLLTSYDIHTLSFTLADARFFELTVPRAEISQFIHCQIKKQDGINQFIESKQTNEDALADVLIAKADGHFLIADQHLKYLEAAEPQTFSQLIRLAKDLSPTLENVWGQAMEELATQVGPTKINAQLILVWLAATGRELDLDLMKHAIAFSGDSESDVQLDEDDLVVNRLLLAPCRGLVQIRESRKTIMFSHSSMYGFFQAHISILGLPNPHAQISLVCLRQFDWLNRHLAQTSTTMSAEMIEEIFETYPLLGYTLGEFGSHFQQSLGSDVIDTYKRLFSDEELSNRIGTILLWKLLPEHWQDNFQPRAASKLHTAAVLRSVTLVTHIVEAGVHVDVLDSAGWTPMRWAVVARDHKMIHFLRSLGSDMGARDFQRLTTLTWSFGEWYDTSHSFGSLTMTDITGMIGNTLALSPYSAQACELGALTQPTNTDVSTLQLLIELSKPSDLRQDGEHLIKLACQKRLGTIVAQLVEANVSIPSDALLIAIIGSCTYIEGDNCLVKGRSESIIGCYMDIHEENWRMENSSVDHLSLDDEWICQLMTEDAVKQLGPRGRSPLSLAAEMGFVQVCEALLRAGASVNERDQDGWTPLRWAVVRPKFVKVYITNCVLEDDATAVLGAAIHIHGRFSRGTQNYLEHDLGYLSERKSQVVHMLLRAGARWLATNGSEDLADLEDQIRDEIPGVAEIMRDHFCPFDNPLTGSERPVRAQNSSDQNTPTSSSQIRQSIARSNISLGERAQFISDTSYLVMNSQIPKCNMNLTIRKVGFK